MTDTSHRQPTSSEIALEQPGGRPQGAVEVVRSEEQVQLGRAVRVSGRAVLRKYVITETVTQTFQVRREEVRLDLEPADDVEDDTSAVSPEVPFGDRAVEVVLHREVPVVQLRVEATERVRLHVDTITEQVPVSAELRQERLDVEAPGS